MNRRRWIEAIGWIVSIGLLSWFLHQSFVTTPFWNKLSWSATSWLALLGIAIVYGLSLVNSGLISWLLLKSLHDQQATPARVLAASLLSQMAKYLPGNVAHHIGRVVLSRELKLSGSRVLFGMFIETLWVLGVAAGLMVFHVINQGDALLDDIPRPISQVILILIVCLAIVGPYLFHSLFERLRTWYTLRQGRQNSDPIALPSIWVALVSSLAYTLNYCLLGLTIALLGGYFFGQWHFDILLLGSAFAVAWVVGFFTPGSPAGLGVREAILLGLLAPVYGTEIAAGITSLLRLTTVLGDTLAWAIGGMMWKVARKF